VAIALVGQDRVAKEWGYNRSLKDRAVRARDRGRAFVQGGYSELLRRASLLRSRGVGIKSPNFDTPANLKIGIYSFK